MLMPQNFEGCRGDSAKNDRNMYKMEYAGKRRNDVMRNIRSSVEAKAGNGHATSITCICVIPPYIMHVATYSPSPAFAFIYFK